MTSDSRFTGRRAVRALFVCGMTLLAGLNATEPAHARRRLFHRSCARPRRCCVPACIDCVRAYPYCPVYGGQEAGEVWLYYGMQHVSGDSCIGPPRPLYYEEEVPKGCSDEVASYGHCFYPGRYHAKKHACDKGYKKNAPVLSHIWNSPNWKRSFVDQVDGTWRKLHLFKVDLDVDGVGGIDFCNVGHGYSPREGDTAAYEEVSGVTFYRTLGKYCGYVEWTDPEGETVRYDVILNKQDDSEPNEAAAQNPPVAGAAVGCGCIARP